MTKTGIELIADERQRQIDVEGWTPEHDEGYVERELADAARCYIYATPHPPLGWPWDEEWWKPSSDLRNLVKAGALIAAEIDRLQGQEKRQEHIFVEKHFPDTDEHPGGTRVACVNHTFPAMDEVGTEFDPRATLHDCNEATES